MKKMIALFLCLCLMAGIVPAFAAASHVITSAEYPFCLQGADIGMKKTLYFLDGAEDLPYMDTNGLLDMLTFLNGDAPDINGKWVSYTMEADGPIVTYTRHHEGNMSDGCTATFDFDKSEIRFQDYNLFLMKPRSSTVLDITTIQFFNDQGDPLLLQKTDRGIVDRYGGELILPLADYDIELVYQPIENGLYLIPLQTITDFIVSAVDGNIFFNGQTVNMTQAISSGDALYYAAPAGERSAALTKYGYNELCLMLDYLYGLKEVHEISSFDQFFHQLELDDVLKGEKVEYADKAICRLIRDYLDDGHSVWLGFSYLTGDIEYTSPWGTSMEKTRVNTATYKNARATINPDGIPGYQEVGNTAYITFDSFATDHSMTAEDYYKVEDPADFADTNTIGLIIKAHAMITRENSPIENVVLDLSCNDGGEADAAAFVIAWLLGEASIGVKDTMTGAMCSCTYRCDANRDGKFDENDTLKGKNLFCLTSPLSFSCGNLVPCALKESGKVTLLGRTSGGGSCIVLFTSSAWGASFRISSPRRLSFIKNGSYYDIDRGADPDFVITKLEKYYDREGLTDYINSLY
jgi:hypothetical protein